MANIKIEKKNEFRIEYTKGDTYALKLTFKNITQDLTSAFFTVKENQDDTTPLIEKTINAGITKLDENFYKKELIYKLQLQATDSQDLEADHIYLYDLKIAVGNVIKTVIKGNFVVTYNVTGVDRITTELAEIEIDDTIETDAETTPATHGIEYETDPVANAKIGDMSTLSTTAKDTLVGAINETNSKASASFEEITKIENGTVTVPSATHSTSADSATNAQNAQNATNAQNAVNSQNSANSQKINNLQLVRDENGILKIGDTIIPQKELLWSGSQQAQNNEPITFTFDNLNIGDTIEVEWEVVNTGGTTRAKSKAIIGASSSSGSFAQIINFPFVTYTSSSSSVYGIALQGGYRTGGVLWFYRAISTDNGIHTFIYPTITKIYKIIE